MRKEIINGLKVELKLLQLPICCKVEDLTPRQFELLYDKKFSYVRNYITWLIQNELPLFCIANFIRSYDNLVDMCYSRFLCLSKSRFLHKLRDDFLVDLSFDEFRWLCANHLQFV